MLTYTHEHREDRSDLSAPMMSIALGIMKTEGNNYAFIDGQNLLYYTYAHEHGKYTEKNNPHF